MARFLYATIDSVSTPRSGEVLVDKYWCVHPDKGICFWEKSKIGSFDFERLSPQCNSDKRVADTITATRDGHIVQKIPAVYMGGISEKSLTA